MIKNYSKYLFVFSLFSFQAFSQNIGINNTGATPNSRAILDIDVIGSDKKGVLIPRVSTDERIQMSLSTSEEGMTVYDKDLNSFWVWDGSVWKSSIYSLGIAMPSIFSVTGSPVFGPTGTLSTSLVSQTANTVFAAPNGMAGVPTFRALVSQDVPSGVVSADNGLNRSGGNNVRLGGTLLEATSINQDNFGFTLNNNGSFNSTIKLDNSGDFEVLDNATSAFFVSDNGRVGVGSNNPQAPLEIRKDAEGNITEMYITNRGINPTNTGSALVFGGYRDVVSNYQVAKIEVRHAPGGAYGNLTHTADMLFYTRAEYNDNDYAERMRITSAGNVGIGTSAVTQGKVVISGSQNHSGTYGWLNSSGNTGTATSAGDYSLFATNRIAASEFNAFSDKRIKKIRGISNSKKDLQTILNLKITDYTFIDSVGKGTQESKKVIAQEVKEIYPQAVSLLTEVVPDIYKLAEIENGNIIVANNLKVGERVKLVFEKSEEIVSVLEANANSFKVASMENGKVFVYGREVKDFHTVDYEALTTLNISATQELMKIISKQEEAIESLKEENSSIKKEVLALDTEVQKIKELLSLEAKSK